MKYLFGLILLNLLSTTVVSPGVHIFSFGMCRSECLERNEKVIVRKYTIQNSVTAALCFNLTKFISEDKNPKSFLLSYKCEPAEGIWKYQPMAMEQLETYSYPCPPKYKRYLQHEYILAIMCRSECLERNKNVIVQKVAIDNSVYAALCFNLTEFISGSKYPKSFTQTYICNPTEGKWKYQPVGQNIHCND
uniref:Uncharacterized protein n=1 Tax=Onchocerca volvulus TaxID=6282 RepID=A0A8R1TJX3_ONCVO